MIRPRGGSVWPIVLPPLAAARLLWFGVFVAVLLLDMAGVAILPGIRTELVHWDGISFLQIAAHGYPTVLDYRDAFLPGFPLLVAGVRFVVRDYVLAAFVVNLVAEAVALWYLAKLVLGERDRASASFCVWVVALAPTALFFTAPFTEAPFMAAAAASLYYARQSRPGAAALCAAAATAFRLAGLALLPALLLEQLARGGLRRPRELALLLVVPLPLVLYCVYMRAHTGDALALFDANGLPSFGHALTAPWDGFRATWHTLVTAPDGETRSIFAREVAFGLLGLVACVAMWVSTRVPRSFALYCSIAWLMAASLSFWRSEPRYFLALFPAVLVLADVTTRHRTSRTAIVAVSGALMCAGTWIYAQGRWLG